MAPHNGFATTVHEALAKYGSEISSESAAILAVEITSEVQLRSFIVGFESNLKVILNNLVRSRLTEDCWDGDSNLGGWCVAVATVSDEEVWPLKERERAIAKMLGVSIQDVAVSILGTCYHSLILTPETPDCSRLKLSCRRPTLRNRNIDISMSTMFLGRRPVWTALARLVIAEKLSGDKRVWHQRQSNWLGFPCWKFGGSLADWVRFLERLTSHEHYTDPVPSHSRVDFLE